MLTAPLIADTGGADGDGLTLLEVLAALGLPRPAGEAHDVWALLVRRGLITYATTPHCVSCGYTTGFPVGWLEARGHAADTKRRPCQCWRLSELPP